MSKRFMGNMNDKEVIDTIVMAKHSFYKYIREMDNDFIKQFRIEILIKP